MKKSFCISIGPVYLLLGLLIHLHAYAAPGKGADQRTIEAFTKLLKVEVPYGSSSRTMKQKVIFLPT